MWAVWQPHPHNEQIFTVHILHCVFGIFCMECKPSRFMHFTIPLTLHVTIRNYMYIRILVLPSINLIQVIRLLVIILAIIGSLL